jgi:hypothetical protein
VVPAVAGRLAPAPAPAAAARPEQGVALLAGKET